ncbi:DegT/DnrJ/EryC1/StrS family aminotransferase [uncultured Bradyrhizobium sp.]|jgi:dTDP-4-amino-4,6-dideoxygalactose transaminase|uniref:DegT/DnrJ/EryC1/StrS family aminotransferase n=1 Tax=uncultured Bradyrhizobium sp. TaxID=199684 RepID=UPI0026274E1E|nr:DegT/DnrJ/EryC1/StrS family aminotransferase [uncultured Bradyrhizobium sp.]
MRERIELSAPGAAYLQYKAEIDQSLEKVLASGRYLIGPELTKFEQEFAAFVGSTFCVGVASGTDAITLALSSLNVGAGDAVITASHTAVATVSGIEASGAVPILVDIEADTYTIDPVRLELAIRHYSKAYSIKAVVAVHLYGMPCALEELLLICKEHKLLLVEDCAQAHGATYNGRAVGTFGAAGAFSFYPTKNLAAFGDGGAITFDQSPAAQKALALRQYGWDETRISNIRGTNSRLDEVQAAFLRIRLKKLANEIVRRREIAETYNTELPSEIVAPPLRHPVTHAYHLYVINTEHRAKISQALSDDNIGWGIHYPAPIHLQPAYQGRIPIDPCGLERTEVAAQRILSLPLHPFLTDGQVARVIKAVRSVF